ncbi:hypothetical protein HRI_003085300 [Hibiscus trionum]|uniref:Uncharacterized protein n=1 Tax=Hibiscus trionum TaxID=183268 RepID=A0A9W7MDE2_HIBTR|nr:hypothetical protein HRI_003085300 [Hibiscus trionum]
MNNVISSRCCIFLFDRSRGHRRIRKRLLQFEMVEVWWSLLGAAIPAILAGQAFRMKKKHAEEQKIKTARGREKSSDEAFVCEIVCTSKRMLKKVGAFSKDPIPDTCVTVCGVSEHDVCSDACARTVCVNKHQNDICLRRCQSECLRLSASNSY